MRLHGTKTLLPLHHFAADCKSGMVDRDDRGSEEESEIPSDAGGEVEAVEDDGLLGEAFGALGRVDAHVQVEARVPETKSEHATQASDWPMKTKKGSEWPF